ncbi:hypothetical protein F4819DRAFT_484092 [Hypoxylon fuscum]|nr:hypothetical protein F4819DRAFT_484092 [Hypoxylon fuscum]
MDEIVKKAIERNEKEAKSLDSVPWKPDEPYAQEFFAYDNSKQAWVPTQCKPLQEPLQEVQAPQGVTRLALFSWNIDFMLPFAKARMDAALDHLEGLVNELGPSTAVVIYLQECIEEDLGTISEKGWVRDKFYLTDTNGKNWATYYGTTTLVDRRLDVASCFRVHYRETRMQRDAFFVDGYQ